MRQPSHNPPPAANTSFMDINNVQWPLHPMEPTVAKEAFDSEDTLFQLKWDGVRVLTYKYADGHTRLFNRRLNERTAQYPEIIAALGSLASGTVLDGEVVALGADGRPDFPRVLRRDLVRSPSKIKIAAAHVPVAYMVFDVLWLCGEAVHTRPLTQRLELLASLPLPSPVHLVESVPAAGKALFEAVKAEGLEGIVAKKAGSAYRIGKKTDDWQKTKCLRSLDTVAGGFIAEDGRFKSLLLGVPGEDGLRFVGAAGSGLSQKQRQALSELFAKSGGACPFANPPNIKGAHWVKPRVKVRVRFLEYTPDGVMRAPAITGISL